MSRPLITSITGAKRKTVEFLFAQYPELANYKLAKMEPIAVTARDGLVLQGYLTMPAGVTANAPMVLLVHGGPWVRDTWGYNPLVQMLGEPRLRRVAGELSRVDGIRQSASECGRSRVGRQDARRSCSMPRSGPFDEVMPIPKRVCIMGGSYGGYAVLAALAFTPDEFACGVDIVGPSNLLTLLRTIPPYWAPMRAMFDKRVGNIDTEEEFLRSRSPLFQAERIEAPLADRPGRERSAREESRRATRSSAPCAKTDKPVEYIVFPDEGHGFARPENSMRFWAATEDFLAKYMGGRAEPPSPEEDWSGFME